MDVLSMAWTWGARHTIFALTCMVPFLLGPAQAQTVMDVCEAITRRLDALASLDSPGRIKLGEAEFRCEEKTPSEFWDCIILDEQSCRKADEVGPTVEGQETRFKQAYDAANKVITDCTPPRPFEEFTYRDWPEGKIVLMTRGRRFASASQHDKLSAAYVVARAKIFATADNRCSRTSIRVEVGPQKNFQKFLD